MHKLFKSIENWVRAYLKGSRGWGGLKSCLSWWPFPLDWSLLVILVECVRALQLEKPRRMWNRKVKRTNEILRKKINNVKKGFDDGMTYVREVKLKKYWEVDVKVDGSR